MEVRKNLTQEDLMQLAHTSLPFMQEMERQFASKKGSPDSAEGQAALIIGRYLNEGKPERNSDSRKQVRFNGDH